MFDGVHRFVLTQTQLRLLMGGLVGGGTWGFGDGHLDWNSSTLQCFTHWSKVVVIPHLPQEAQNRDKLLFHKGYHMTDACLISELKIFVKEKMFCSRVHIFAKFGVRTLLEVEEGMQVVCEEMRLRENHKKTATCGANMTNMGQRTNLRKGIF